MAVKNIMVVGAGQMGSGIAQVAAQAGYSVVLHDISDDLVQKGLSGIQKQLDKAVSKGKLAEGDKDGALDRIQTTTSLESVKDRDLVVEAVVEKMEIKAEVFAELDKNAPSSAILATNTSSLPITRIGATTNRPSQVIGMHFMNPVPVMKLVEVINGLATSPEVTATVKEVSEQLGKVPVECRDVPGSPNTNSRRWFRFLNRTSRLNESSSPNQYHRLFSVTNPRRKLSGMVLVILRVAEARDSAENRQDVLATCSQPI